MIFALPAAGAAMIMCAKKENREMAMSLIGAAVLTTFLTGITEPIEFTFLFLAPMLYIFHVIMCGISF
jgi:phosphotransferase system  glucose/maltose/N-acetylglucosamine-specific IIC component